MMKKEKKSEVIWLCKCEINWADECDFTWFEIFTDKEKKEFLAYLKKHADDYTTVSFGTNEDSEYSGEDIESCLEWKRIPNKETKKFLDDFVCGNEISDITFEDEDDSEDDDSDEEEI